MCIKDIDFSSDENRVSTTPKSSIITKSVKKQLYSTESNSRDELFNECKQYKTKAYKSEKIQQKLIKMDSILKSQASNLENE